ncbi:ATP-binding cassette sub-family A member 17-like [Battus philenor]|uniref:ATP-binding cassette sub-family A member 17-like n=1 Tax=Battus philenor TaxID=42288 RepID=UPI0035D0700C
MAVFTVLMWKHFVVRKRRYVMTCLEMFTPVLLLLPLVGFRNIVTNITEDIPRTTPTATAPQVFYTPDTELTRMLMEQISQALYMPMYNPLPKKYQRYYLSPRARNSEASFKAMQNVDGVVVFENITMKQFRRSGHAPDPRKVTDVVFFVINGITFLAPMLSFTLIMLRINEEKSSGIQEIVEMAGVTPTMICFTQLLNSIPPSIIIGVCGTMLCYAVPIQAHPVIMFLGWFLHFLTIIAMAFVYSYLTKTDGGIDFSNWSGQLHQYEDGAKSGSVKLSCIMQLIQIGICFILSWYLELVRPKKFGIQWPWYFLCQKSFWSKKSDVIESELIGKVNRDPCYDKYFEEPPENAQEIVNVVKVQMVHKSNRATVFALDNVSIKFYKGDITVIIGHNGAGKTTLISIIAGILEQTSGRVFVEGLDTMTHRSHLRGKIALCPQHSIYFPYLTVKEHLIFFSKIRGDSSRKALEYSEEILKQLDLFNKASWTPGKLSHGMLRRLQVGCMLCGDADLLLLDEPTTGLDVEARRELWDVLLTLRGHRTVIMTTHFLEEAQILGDRVVALHSGIIRCYATPMYLKNAIGSGYRLSMTTMQSPDLHKMTSIVREVSPDAVLSDKIMRTVVYDIPPATDMPALCNRLETIRAELELESLGIGHVTLEEAFIKLCSDVHVNGFYESEPDLKNPDEFTYNHGWTLFITQTRELFKRQLDYSAWKLMAFLSLQFFLPFIFCLLLTYVLNNPREQEYLLMDLNMYNEVDAPVATYNLRSNLSNKNEAITKLKNFYPHLILRGQKEKEDHDKLCDCEKCKTHKWTFSRNIIDIYVDDNQAKLNYDKSVKHSASVGLNLLSNIIAAQRLNRLPEKAINMQLVYGNWSLFSPLMRFGFDALEAEAMPMLIMDHLSMFVPMHMFMLTIKRMTDSARYNIICMYYHQFCNDTDRPHDVYTDVCCDRSMEHGYWFNHYAMTKFGMGIPLIIVSAQALVFGVSGQSSN